MVAVIAGTGLGLFNSSLHAVGAQGVQGNTTTSGIPGSGLANTGSTYVNAATGNLIIQSLDETLSVNGADIQHLRTYNAQGNASDGDSDRWRWLGEKRVVLHGSENSAGSWIIRTSGDGRETRFDWNGSVYLSSDGEGAHDQIQRVGSEWVYTEGSTQTQEYYNHSTGWISALRDKSGAGFDYVFEGNRLKEIHDAASTGQSLILNYDGNDRLSSIDTRSQSGGALTRQVYFEHDSSGRLTFVRTDLTPSDNSIVDNNIYQTEYQYDGTSHRVSAIIQSDGTRVDFTYIQHGGEYKVDTLTDQFGLTDFNYFDGRTEVINGTGDRWNYYFDNQARITRVESALVGDKQSVTHYAYDDDDNVTAITDGENNTVHNDYDANGNLTESYDAEGNYVRRSYNANNQLISETQYRVASTSGTPSGEATSYFIYDAQSRLRYTLSPEGRVSETRYNAMGQVSHEYQIVGNTFSASGLSSDSNAWEAQLNSWRGSQDLSQSQLTEYRYDYRGNLEQTSVYANVNSNGEGILDSAATISEFVYSEHGQLLQTLSVTGSERTDKTVLQSHSYDGLGRLTSTFSANGTLNMSYHSGSVVQTHVETGLSTTRVFDNRGRLQSVSAEATGESTRTTRYFYDDAGRLRMEEAPDGGRRYTFYDHIGRVTHQVTAGGTLTSFEYDDNNRVLSETVYANPPNTGDWFNGSEVVQSVGYFATSADDRTTRYVYDNAGRLLRSEEEFGDQDRITQYTYDGASRLIQTTQGDRDSIFFYDQDGAQIGYVNAENFLSETIYDEAGRIVVSHRYDYEISEALKHGNDFSNIKAAIDAANPERLSQYYFYDAQGRQVGFVDEQGFLSETYYDAANRRTTTRNYLSPVTVSNSDTLISVRNNAGDYQDSDTHFDNFGRTSWTQAYGGTISRIEYNSAGQIVKTTTAEGTPEQRSARTAYNAFGEVSGTVSGEGEAAINDLTTAINQFGRRYEYDAMGRTIAEFGPEGQKSLHYYDQAGRLTHVVNAEGNVSISQYNAFDQIESVRVLTYHISTDGLTGGDLTSTLTDRINAALHSSDAIVSSTYNQLGLVASETDAEGYTTQYQYDAHGDLRNRIQAITDTRNVQTHYVYDKLGALVQTYRDYQGVNALTSTSYDGFGRVIANTDANGHQITTDYIDNGRTIVMTDALGGASRTEVDAFGRTVQHYDALGHLTAYEYDDLNRQSTVTHADGSRIITIQTRHGETLQVEDQNGHITRYTYTKDGALETVTDALGVVTTDNEYDASGRLYESADGNGTITRYSYDAANRVTTKTVDPDGLNLQTTYQFDGQGRQTFVTEGAGTSEARTTHYIYDRNGRIQRSIVDPEGLQQSTIYIYDGLGRTTGIEKGTVSHPAEQVTWFEFDNLGRKTAERIDPEGLNLTTQFEYDSQGNLVRRVDANGGVTHYRYDANHRLRFTVDPVGAVAEHQYDAEGNLIGTRQYAKTLPAGQAMKLWHVEGTNRSASHLLGNFSAGDVVTATIRFKSDSDVNAALFVGDTGGDDPYDNTVYRQVYGSDGWQTLTLTHTMSHDDQMSLFIYADPSGSDDSKFVLFDNIEVHSEQRSEVLYEDFEDGIDEWVISGRAETASISQVEVGTYEELQAIADSLGDRLEDRITRYSYDTLGRLQFTIDPNGAVTEQQYDAKGQLTSTRQYAKTLPAGQGMKLWHVEGTNRSASHGLGDFSAGDVVTATIRFKSNTDVNAGLFVGDAGGADPYDNTVYRQVYGSDGWQTLTVTHTMSHDDQMSLFVYADPSGADDSKFVLFDNIHVSSEARGEVLYEDFEGGIDDWWSISGHAEVASVSQAEAGTREQVLAIANSLADSVEDRITRYSYDAAGRLQFTIDPNGAVTEHQYDAIGQVISTRQYAKTLPAGQAMKLWHVEGTNRSASHGLGSFSAGDVVTATIRFKSDSDVNAALFVGDAGGADPYDNTVYRQVYGSDGWQTMTVTHTMSHDDQMSLFVYADPSGSDDSKFVLFDNIHVHSEQRGEVLYEDFELGINEWWSISGHAEVENVSQSEAGTHSQLIAIANSLADSAEDSITRYSYDTAGRLQFTINPNGAVTEHQYDALGQVISTRQYAKTIPAGTAMKLWHVEGTNRSASHGLGSFSAGDVVTATIRFKSDSDVNAALFVGDDGGADPYDNTVYRQVYGSDGWQTLTVTHTMSHDDQMSLFVYADPSGADDSKFVLFDNIHVRSEARGEVLYEDFEAGIHEWWNISGHAEVAKVSQAEAGTREQVLAIVNGLADSVEDRITRYSYDAAGRLQLTIDPNGVVTEHQYDALGQVVSTRQYAKTLPAGQAMKLWHVEGTNRSASHGLGSFSAGDVVTATIRFKSDSDVNAALFVGDDGGADPYDNTVYRQVYGSDGWQTLTVTHTMSHDDQMSLFVYADPSGADDSKFVLFDNVHVHSEQRGEVLYENFEAGIHEWWNISGHAEVAKVSQAEAGTYSQLIAIANSLADSAEDRITHYSYDAAGRLQLSIDPNGAVTEHQYDALGQVISTRQYAKTLPAGQAMKLWHVEGTNRSASHGLGSFSAGDVVTATIRFKSDSDVNAALFVGDDGGADPYDNTVYRQVYGSDGWQTLTVTHTMSHDDQMSLFVYADPSGADDSKFVLFDNIHVRSEQRGEVFYEDFEAGIHEWWNISGHAEVANVSQVEAGTREQVMAIANSLADSAEDRITRYSYDIAGRLQFTIDPNGAVTEHQYDALGQVISTRQYAKTVPAGTAMKLWHVEGTNRSASHGLGNFSAGDVVTATIRFKSNSDVNAALFVGDDGGADPYDNTVYKQVYGTDGWQTLTVTHTMSHDDQMSLFVYADPSGADDSKFVLFDNVHVHSEARGEVLYEDFEAGIHEWWNISGQAEEASVSQAEAGTHEQILAIVNSLADSVDDRITRYSYDASGRLQFTINPNGAVTEHQYDAMGQVIGTRQYAKTVPAGAAMKLWHVEGTNRSASHGLGSFSAGDVVTATIRFKSDSDVNAALFVGDDGGADPYDNTVYRQVYGSDGWKILTVTHTMSHDDQMSLFVYSDPSGSENSKFVLFDNIHVHSEQRGDVLYEDFERGIDAWEINGRAELANVSLDDGMTNSYLDDVIQTLETSSQDQHSQIHYDANGNPRFTIDALGYISEAVYDAFGRVTHRIQYTEKPDHVLRSYADVSAYLETLSNDAQVQWQYQYDQAGRLVREVSPQVSIQQGENTSLERHIVTQYQYDTYGNMHRRTEGLTATVGVNGQVELDSDQAQARSTYYTYDQQGRQIYMVDALDHLVQSDYNSFGELVKTTRYATALDGLSRATSREIESLRQNSSDDRTTEYAYDDLGRRVYTIEGEQVLSKTEYNHFGDVVGQLTFAMDIGTQGKVNGVRHTASLNALTSDSPLGVNGTRGERYTYDQRGHLQRMEDALGQHEEYTYDTFGNRTSLTNKSDHTWHYEFDRLNRLVKEISPEVSVSINSDSLDRHIAKETQYDAMGNVISVTEGLSYVRTAAGSFEADGSSQSQARTTEYEYDSLNRQVKTIDPGYYDLEAGRFYDSNASGRQRRETHVVYDEFGNAVANHVTLGDSLVVSHHKAYDALGRITHEVDGENYVTSYLYNAFGEQSNVTRHDDDASLSSTNATTRFTRNQIAQSFQSDADLDRSINTYYNNLGQKIRVTQSSVNIVGTVGLAEGVNGTEDEVTPETTYEYNAFGEITLESTLVQEDTASVNEEWANIRRYYDNLGREVLTVDAMNYATVNTHDRFGNIIRTDEYANAAGTSSNPYNLGFGWYTTSSGNDHISKYTYDALNRQVETRRLNHSYSVWNSATASFDSVSYGRSTNAEGQLVLTQGYDDLGNLKSMEDAAGNTTNYEYNALGQLTKVTQPERTTIVSENVNPGQEAIDPFLSGSEISVAPEVRMTVDVFGNVVREEHDAMDARGGTRTYLRSYDHLGNEVSSTDAEQSELIRKFDHAGRVIEERRDIATQIPGYVNAEPVIVDALDFLSTDAQPGYVPFSIMNPEILFYYDPTNIASVDVEESTQNILVFHDAQEQLNTTTLSITYHSPAELGFYNHTTRRHFYYDKNGNQRATIDLKENLDGSITRSGERLEFNAFGESEERSLVSSVDYGNYGAPAQPNYASFTSLTKRHIVETNVYDQAGRLVRKTQGDGDTRFDYDLLGNLTRWTSLGSQSTSNDDRKTLIVRDIKGRAVEERLPHFKGFYDGGTITGGSETLASRYAGEGQTLNPTRYQEYDRWNNVTRKVDEGGAATLYWYNHNNQVANEISYASIVDMESSTTSNRVDILAQRHDHRLYYDERGLAIGEEDFIDVAGQGTTKLRTRRAEYDEAGNLKREIDATGKTNEYRHDAFGNQIAKRDGMGFVTISDYDANNRVIAKRFLRLNASSTTADRYSTLKGRYYTGLSSTDRARSVLLSKFRYDGAGRRYLEIDYASETDVDGVHRKYIYDSRGNLIRSENESGIAITYGYDAFGRKTSETNALGDSQTWTYLNDYRSQLVDTYVDYADVLKRYSYNDFGQMQSEQIDGSSQPGRAYTYLHNGLLETVRDEYEVSRHDFNFGSIPTSIIVSHDVTQHYAYDIRGLRVKEQSESMRQVNQGLEILEYAHQTYSDYDEKGRLVRVESPRATESGRQDEGRGVLNYLNYGFDAMGNRVYAGSSYVRSGATGSNSMNQWYAYDNEGRTVIEAGELDDESNAVVLVESFDPDNPNDNSYTHQYDNAGRVARTTRYGGYRPTETWSVNVDKDRWNSGYYRHSDSSRNLVINGYEYYPDHEDIQGEIIGFMDSSPHSDYYVLQIQSSSELVYVHDVYEYDEFGRQELHKRGSSYWVPVDEELSEVSRSVYNLRGFETTSFSGLNETSNFYHDDGRVKLSRTVEHRTLGDRVRSESRYGYRYDEVSGQVIASGTRDAYDAAGNLVYYQSDVLNYDSGELEHWVDEYELGLQAFGSAYKVASETLTITNQPGTPNTREGNESQYDYDVHGNLKQVVIGGDSGGTKTFGYDIDGRVIDKKETMGETPTRSTSYFYQGGNYIGEIHQRGASLVPGIRHDAGDTPGNYTIVGGESLSNIAQSVFGDGSLWYLIAEANGLTKGPSDTFSDADIGRNLTIPNTDSSLKNQANSFKPYNPGEIIGSTSPSSTFIPPPVDAGCNTIATIIIIIIVVVVTYFTAGAATTAISGGANAGFGATVAGGAIGGFVGSAAGQLAGIALGQRESFSLKEMAAAGIAGAITAGIGYGLGDGASTSVEAGKIAKPGVQTGKAVTQLAKYTSDGVGTLNPLGRALQGAGNAAANVVSRKAVGLESSFSWRNIAAGAVSSTINGLRNDSLVSPGLDGFSQFAYGFGNGLLSGAVSAAVTNAFVSVGGKQEWKQVAADAFGNALASGILSATASSSQSERVNQEQGAANRDNLGRDAYNDYLEQQVGALPEGGLYQLDVLPYDEWRARQAQRTGLVETSSLAALDVPDDDGAIRLPPIVPMPTTSFDEALSTNKSNPNSVRIDLDNAPTLGEVNFGDTYPEERLSPNFNSDLDDGTRALLDDYFGEPVFYDKAFEISAAALGGFSEGIWDNTFAPIGRGIYNEFSTAYFSGFDSTFTGGLYNTSVDFVTDELYNFNFGNGTVTGGLIKDGVAFGQDFGGFLLDRSFDEYLNGGVDSAVSLYGFSRNRTADFFTYLDVTPGVDIARDSGNIVGQFSGDALLSSILPPVMRATRGLDLPDEWGGVDLRNYYNTFNKTDGLTSEQIEQSYQVWKEGILKNKTTPPGKTNPFKQGSLRAGHGIKSTLSSDGTLRVKVRSIDDLYTNSRRRENAGRKLGKFQETGSDLILKALVHHGDRVKRFEAKWVDNENFRGNFDTFKQNLGLFDNDQIRAAKSTHTGKVLQAAGFSGDIRILENTVGRVIVEFERN